MKGAFETGIVLFFGMMFLWMGISMVQVMWAYNQARYLQEFALSTIERQNRFDSDVLDLIDVQAQHCDRCVLTIEPIAINSKRYRVNVGFPVQVSVFGIQAMAQTSATTRPVS